MHTTDWTLSFSFYGQFCGCQQPEEIVKTLATGGTKGEKQNTQIVCKLENLLLNNGEESSFKDNKEGQKAIPS